MTATAFVTDPASGIKVEQGGVITVLKSITEFFNVGDGKVAAGEWRKEVMSLNAGERQALAAEIADVTGWTISGVNA